MYEHYVANYNVVASNLNVCRFWSLYDWKVSEQQGSFMTVNQKRINERISHLIGEQLRSKFKMYCELFITRETKLKH